jgi:hypothetical protein
MGVHNRATEEEIAEIRRLANEGLSANAISRNIGRDPHLVARYAPECAQRYRQRRVFSVTINKIPEVIHKALSAAARRRSMKLETIMLQLVGGVAMRGSIDRTLQKWNAYNNERRLGTCDGHGAAEQKRAGEGQNATGESLEV